MNHLTTCSNRFIKGVLNIGNIDVQHHGNRWVLLIGICDHYYTIFHLDFSMYDPSIRTFKSPLELNLKNFGEQVNEFLGSRYYEIGRNTILSCGLELHGLVDRFNVDHFSGL